MAIVITEIGEHDLPEARADGTDLWVSAPSLERTTGWILKPEGLCRGSICVPVSSSLRDRMARDGAVNVTALWRHMGRPLAHDRAGAVWSLGEDAGTRTTALRSLEAPDFALPDLAGHPHRLSDHRGRRVMVVSWASW